MENKSTSRNNVLLQPTASVDIADLEKQETCSPVSQQTETKHSPHDHSYYMPDLSSLEDSLVRAKQLQDGQVPEDLQRLAATKVSYGKSDRNLNRDMDDVTKQVTKADADSNKHTAIQHQQPQDAASMPTLTVSSCPPQPLVLPALAEDSVRRHYVSPTLQATPNRLIVSVVNSLSQQSNGNAVNNASSRQPEDLLVAVPVEDDEVHGYAVSHDVSQDKVHKRIQMIQARRYSCRLYFAVFLLVAAAVMIVLIVVLRKNKSGEQEQGTETETTVLQNMTQLIVSIMGVDAGLLNDASSPYAKALSWLLQRSKRNKSKKMTNSLAQRFYAASFYYDTTTDDDKWTDCNPSTSLSVLGQTCTDPFNNTAQAWLSDSHECDWAGVFCDNHQQIIGLGFKDNNLVGTIPSSVAKFPFLYLLWSTFSRLEGNISSLSNCHHLTFVYLDYNLLSGDLSVLWQNRKISVVELVNNNFTGSLSSQIGNLVDITFFSIYGNKVTGTIPSEVGWFDSMYHFDIGNNYFRGELPSSMRFWSFIEYLVVSENSLSGSIPTFFGQLNKTVLSLYLRDNEFTGTLPDELFQSELQVLDVSNNELSGTLGARFAQLTSSQSNTSIVELYLSGNHFSGTIPTEFGLLIDLAFIDLQGNDFTGSVPASLCQHSVVKLVADCAKDDNGQVELQCDCCTECCQGDGTQCKPI